MIERITAYRRKDLSATAQKRFMYIRKMLFCNFYLRVPQVKRKELNFVYSDYELIVELLDGAY